ncbi:MAG: hypothetical protein KZQ74_16885 [gamma proteobacterium symbiont of Bathyaustriella thionipta]|nr:hypothetical protein [gamma proteobacterium symbiont of Bathyaustriella thionipta]MCU7951434.1 hypothetical protein [gamma proteobacterium symbiont of Bathyaustriella thionipta]MCU7957992.1 hypothetical protein [gamma proteobacterium symbiont of Bathyaustriella thionipta]MCU7968835.1 hypothetical protein [gamma proteobacterium symbiont of Bathyaustriella thionipta]
MIKSQYDMVFYPKETDLSHVLLKNNEVPDFAKLIRRLQSEGFIGESFSTRYTDQKEILSGYFIGDNFFKFITFLGCSPHIEVVEAVELLQKHLF